jgi:signal peptidase I
VKRLPGRLWAFAREWLVGLVPVLLFLQFAVSAVRVDGVSMMPGLRHGETVAIPKYEGWAHHLGLGSYARGDVVVFKPPASATAEWKHDYRGIPLPWAYRPYLIKRVIGVAGDRVSIRQGRVSVNGQLLDQSWTLPYWQGEGCLDTGNLEANLVQSGLFPSAPRKAEIVVPAHSVFVMGDNRSPGGSLDSRFFGPVDLADVAGRALLSVWPIVRKADAQVPCAGVDAKNEVQTSGADELNLRLLQPPAGFGAIGQAK